MIKNVGNKIRSPAPLKLNKRDLLCLICVKMTVCSLKRVLYAELFLVKLTVFQESEQVSCRGHCAWSQHCLPLLSVFVRITLTPRYIMLINEL